MNRSQLIATVAKMLSLPADTVEAVLDTEKQQICECLKRGESVTIKGFGRFEMRNRKTKAYVNPKTKVPSQLDPTSTPGFKASGLMKKAVGK